MDVWSLVLILGLCLLPLLPVADRAGARRGAEKQIFRLVEAGWAPSPAVHAAAVEQRVREHRVSHLTAVAGALTGVVLVVLAGQPAARLGWGWIVGTVLGMQAGRVIMHLRAGRLRQGPRFVELRPRRARDYLPRADRAAGAIHLAVVIGSMAIILGLWPNAAAQGGQFPLLPLVATVVWCVLPLTAARLVTRARLAAGSRDALRGQDAWRSVTVRDLVHLLGGAAMLAVMTLWLVSTEWPAPPWVTLTPYLGLAATFLAMALPQLGRPVIPPLPASAEVR